MHKFKDGNGLHDSCHELQLRQHYSVEKLVTVQSRKQYIV